MKKILVADDEEDILNATRDILEAAGYAVIAASNGEEALEKITAESPDLLILDLMMPEMDGASLAYELKMSMRSTATPVIFYSAAVARDSAPKTVAKLENTRFLAKPFEVEELLSLVKIMLGEESAR